LKNTKVSFLADNTEDAPRAVIKKYDRELLRASERYHKHLETIADRLGPKAYNFFQFGFADTGLHDAYLLSCSFGDAIGKPLEEAQRLKFGRSKSQVEMRMLTYGRDRLHRFVFKGIRRLVVDIPSETTMDYNEDCLGQVYTYEVVAASEKYLRCEWLLDSGGTIVIESRKIEHFCKRVKPPQPQRKSKRM
jgi:hypothetical protein